MTKFNRVGKPTSFFSKRPTKHYIFLRNETTKESATFGDMWVNPKFPFTMKDADLLIALWKETHPDDGITNLFIGARETALGVIQDGDIAAVIPIATVKVRDENGRFVDGFVSMTETPFWMAIADTHGNSSIVDSCVNPGREMEQHEVSAIIEMWRSKYGKVDTQLAIWSFPKNLRDCHDEMAGQTEDARGTHFSHEATIICVGDTVQVRNGNPTGTVH